jgi:phospholipase/carboxylesterase
VPAYNLARVLLRAFILLLSLVSGALPFTSTFRDIPMHFSAANPAEGRLSLPPNSPASGECEPGLRSLGIRRERDAFLYVPAVARKTALPLVVLLHGSGADAHDIIGVMRSQADRDRFLLLVPQSTQYTWDVVLGGYGSDVRYIDLALQQTFAKCNVNRDKIAISGFSDGASYALSLGLNNGRLFSHVFAFSPGFMVPGEHRGRPAVFISHGTADNVLPIARCSRVLVPQLREDGYKVDYREFSGGHQVPTEMVDGALKNFLNKS